MVEEFPTRGTRSRQHDTSTRIMDEKGISAAEANASAYASTDSVGFASRSAFRTGGLRRYSRTAATMFLRMNAAYRRRAITLPPRPMTSQKCTGGAEASCPVCTSSSTQARLTCATPTVAKSMPRDLLSSTGRRLVSRYSRKKSSTLTMYCRVWFAVTARPWCTAVACVSCSKKSTVMKVAGLSSPIIPPSMSTPRRRSSKMFSPAWRSARSSSISLVDIRMLPSTDARMVFASGASTIDPPPVICRSCASSL